MHLPPPSPSAPRPSSRAIRGAAGAVLAVATLTAIACSGAETDARDPRDAESPGIGAASEPSPLVRTAFRVRLDPAVPLGADTGWAAPTNEPAVVDADRPFRLRFEVEADAGVESPGDGVRFGLQVHRNDGPWTDLLPRDFPYPDEISTPAVSIVSTGAYDDGAPTGDLLNGSETPFAGGAGVSLDSVTPAWRPGGGADEAGSAGPAHGEWEWPVVIRRFADGAVTNEEGDTFTFRMVDGEGRPVEGTAPATVTLEVPEGLLGGTYVETPGVLGPWQAADGSLYFPMEPAETFNVLMTVKSPDFGASWVEVDGDDRPATDDLEGFGTAVHDGRIYMLHQISEATVLHAFRTTDVRDAPDTWEIRDEPVSRHTEPPTQVAALVARSDGSLVAVYGDSLGLLHRIRAPGGDWGAEGRVDTPDGLVASGVMAVLGDDDVVHLAYTASDGTEGSVWHRTLTPADTLTPARRLATGIGVRDEDAGSVAPLVHLEGTGSVVVLYRLADGALVERRVRADGSLTPPARVTERRVVQSGADSEQVGADAVARDGTVHVLFIDEETRDLWHTSSEAPGVWSPAVPVVEGIDAQWVRGRVIRSADGAPVYGFVYDAGSDGGSGMNRYGEVELPAR